MKIKDINKAEKLKGQDQRDLRTLLRLSWNPKARSSYTEAELRAESKAYYFIELGILQSDY